MKKNTQFIALVILILVLYYFFQKANTRRILDEPMSNGNGNGNGDIPGCTQPGYANYNPLATVNDGSCIALRQGCCDGNAQNFDNTCANDPNCQCSQQACNLVTGRNACCDPSSGTYDASCQSDPNCVCDQGLCASIPGGTTRTSCCALGMDNYDSTCATDPFCQCDNSICQQPPASQVCYSNCVGTGFQSITTTLACGTGSATAFPNTIPPNCAGNQGA